MKGKQHTVCHSVDPVKSMVHKLAEVVKNSPEALRHDLEGLTNDLEKIPAAGLTDEQVKVWVKQVQELIYDFEDWQLESKVGAWQISKFKDLIRDSRDRYARYNLLKKALATDACLVNMYPSSSKAQATSDDPPLLWGERPILIGIDVPKRELIQNHLKDDKKSLTVLSILGVGGLGKTTLAKEIYGDLPGQFSCKASVFLGRNPSMKKILLDIANTRLTSTLVCSFCDE
jgi:disease resistance protein RPM1